MKRIKQLMLSIVIISTSLISAQAQQQPKDWQYSPGAPAVTARANWQKLTAGDDLALGKKVQFFPKPNYGLTTDENDPYDLTDGKLSSRLDDRVWFSKDAVGWDRGLGIPSGILMVIDLGSEQPVGQIAIRVLGGHEQGGLVLPASIEFLASDDGQQYYSLQKMVKLTSGEKELSNFKTSFYIPEEHHAFMVPLVCHEAVRARYIALRVTPESTLYTDQISILKAPATTVLKDLQSFSKTVVYTDGLVFTPRHNPLTVTTNIHTANWFVVTDNSGLDPSKNSEGFRLELPQGLRVVPNLGFAYKTVTANTEGNSYEYDYKGPIYSGMIGPIWIEKEIGATIPADATVKLTAILQGKDSHSTVTPLQLVEIPEVPPLKNLDISLAWIDDTTERTWPNFLSDFRKMGFRSVSSMPYFFTRDKDGQWNDAVKKNLDFLQQARQQGYKIVSNDSPFGHMWRTIQTDQKAGKIDDAQAQEIYNQVDGKRGQYMNLLYRGTYFQDEIKRVANLAALVQPDEEYFDIEWWPPVVAESKKDPRVIAAWKASGKSWDDFVSDIGTEVLGDLTKAVRQAVPSRKISIGLYNSDPTNTLYDSIFQWNKIYPGIVDIAMPSLYVQGRAAEVAKRVSYDYQQMQSRQIIPWLTGGTYGEFDPQLTEPMVLESILNGAKGVTYYWFGDFDPMDFYYHSEALARLAPYQKLLQAGKPIAYQGDNPDLHYTCFASANAALVLVGNYNKSSRTKVTLPLPLRSIHKVMMDGKALEIKNNTVSLDVPPGEIRLISFSDSNADGL